MYMYVYYDIFCWVLVAFLKDHSYLPKIGRIRKTGVFPERHMEAPVPDSAARELCQIVLFPGKLNARFTVSGPLLMESENNRAGFSKNRVGLGG